MKTDIREETWDKLNFSSKNSGSQVSFYKLQEGVNRVRIVSNCTMTLSHFERTQEGRFKSVPCIGNEECPLCHAGSRARRQTQCIVIDKNQWDPETKKYNGPIEAKIATFPYTITKDIGALAADPEYGDVTKYDIKIIKTGKGLDTTYSTSPSPSKVELTEEERAVVEAAPKVKDIIKVFSPEEIRDMHFIVLDGESHNNSASATSSASSKSDKAKDGNWDEFD